VGPNGAGARAKLVINLVLGLNRLALAEGLLFGLRQGLDGRALLAVLKDSGAYSRAMDLKGERMVEGNFEAEGKLVQHLKDVELMLEVGHAAGGPAAGDRAPPAAPARGCGRRPGRPRQFRDHRGAPLAHRRTALKSVPRGRARSAILVPSSLKILVGRRDPAMFHRPRPHRTALVVMPLMSVAKESP
jgi:hypothetical protein